MMSDDQGQTEAPVFEDDPNTPDTPPEHQKIAVYPPPGQTHIVMPHGLTYPTPISGDHHIWVRRDDLPFALAAPPDGAGCSLHRNYDTVDHRTLMPTMQGAPATVTPVVEDIQTQVQVQVPTPAQAAVTRPVAASQPAIAASAAAVAPSAPAGAGGAKVSDATAGVGAEAGTVAGAS